MNFIFFGSGESPLRWLGALVHSAGDRILFFPGFANFHFGLEKYGGSAFKTSTAFEVDHASLERDRRSWHLTSTNRTDHENVPATVDLGESRVLWFGLSVSSIDVLRLLTRITVVSADAPTSDASRRASVLSDSLKNTEHNIVQLNTEHSHQLSNRFLHFWFVVGTSGFPEYLGPHQAFPLEHPYLVRNLEIESEKNPIRTHRVKLSDEVDVQVTATLIPGSLKVPVAFYTPGREMSDKCSLRSRWE
jgi:hypothetical protein